MFTQWIEWKKMIESQTRAGVLSLTDAIVAAADDKHQK